MQHILVSVDDKTTPQLSAVELCKVFEASHEGVIAAAIVRERQECYPEDVQVGVFYTTQHAHERLDPNA